MPQLLLQLQRIDIREAQLRCRPPRSPPVDRLQRGELRGHAARSQKYVPFRAAIERGQLTPQRLANRRVIRILARLRDGPGPAVWK